MARKLRLEFPGAVYHVINRGNRRVGPFDKGGAAEAFEGCLGEACERYGWVILSGDGVNPPRRVT
jgi:hypothetical protein